MYELKIILGNNSYPLKIKPLIIEEGVDFFKKMDVDMEKGWQMGQIWVEKPNQLQKCQIAAERLFTSIHNGRKETAIMMAAYIIYHLPKTKSIDIDTAGNMQDTIFLE
ncbi:MAG: hypothetical protein VX544_01025 [Pseudomonadota bacterium]|nr:hypothetical protein [Pseudomonadota bacterium]|tara:strand:+ start:1241 stop:1564 length:324 start_codon:yes stop_codon:yes gene_type:complete